jgi:hypothetical protein
MPSLLSGSLKNTSAPSGYANTKNLQFQLGPTPNTSTGYTLISNTLSQAKFVSSLGNVQFTSGTMYSNVPNTNIRLLGTDSATVVISGSQTNYSSSTGVLVVEGGVGIEKGLYTGDDINVNGLTVGVGYKGVNNIAITAQANSSTNNTTDGENNVVIGYSALTGLSSALNTIAIGRYALSSGTSVSDSIAIGDSSLQAAGSAPNRLIGSISNIQRGTSTVITLPGHNLSTGTVVRIVGIIGTTQLNNQNYLINTLSSSTFRLYPYGDVTYSFPVDSTTFTNYISDGTVSKVTQATRNIAIGSNSGKNFTDGTTNFFLGYNAAPNFTTGSFNFFIGYDTVSNMTHGNNNFSINGKNLVDGIDNQINIGTVFYYNGSGFLELNSTVGLGLGDDATNTTSTGALNVYGGVGISGSAYIGNNLNVSGTGTVFLAPTAGGTVTIIPQTVTGVIDNMVIGQNIPKDGYFLNLKVQSSTNAASTTTGALQVIGGVGIGKDVRIGTNLYVANNANITNSMSAFTATITSSQVATNQTTGALTVAGGIGSQGSIYSADGNPELNNLLYAPTVTISENPPNNPKPGQFWINSANFAEYQWVLDNGNGFWIQIAQL